VPGCQVSRGCLFSQAVPTVALDVGAFRVDVLDVDDGTEPGACRVRVQGRLVPGRGDGPATGLGPHLLLLGDIEVHWEVTVTVRGSVGDGYDFTGPSVGGDRTDRNLGLVWGADRNTATRDGRQQWAAWRQARA
jgi:hypothetical protein